MQPKPAMRLDKEYDAVGEILLCLLVLAEALLGWLSGLGLLLVEF